MLFLRVVIISGLETALLSVVMEFYLFMLFAFGTGGFFSLDLRCLLCSSISS